MEDYVSFYVLNDKHFSSLRGRIVKDGVSSMLSGYLCVYVCKLHSKTFEIYTICQIHIIIGFLVSVQQRKTAFL